MKSEMKTFMKGQISHKPKTTMSNECNKPRHTVNRTIFRNVMLWLSFR